MCRCVSVHALLIVIRETAKKRTNFKADKAGAEITGRFHHKNSLRSLTSPPGFPSWFGSVFVLFCQYIREVGHKGCILRLFVFRKLEVFGKSSIFNFIFLFKFSSVGERDVGEKGRNGWKGEERRREE